MLGAECFRKHKRVAPTLCGCLLQQKKLWGETHISDQRMEGSLCLHFFSLQVCQLFHSYLSCREERCLSPYRPFSTCCILLYRFSRLLNLVSDYTTMFPHYTGRGSQPPCPPFPLCVASIFFDAPAKSPGAQVRQYNRLRFLLFRNIVQYDFCLLIQTGHVIQIIIVFTT